MARSQTNPESLRGQNVVSFPGAGTVPKPPPGIPDEPNWSLYFGRKRKLCEAASREWEYIIHELGRAEIVVTMLERNVLRDYCVCEVRVAWLESQLNTPSHATDRGPAKAPVFSPLNQYRAQLRFYIDRLGLSPRSRQDLTVKTSDEGQGLELD